MHRSSVNCRVWNMTERSSPAQGSKARPSSRSRKAVAASLLALVAFIALMWGWPKTVRVPVGSISPVAMGYLGFVPPQPYPPHCSDSAPIPRQFIWPGWLQSLSCFHGRYRDEYGFGSYSFGRHAADLALRVCCSVTTGTTRFNRVARPPHGRCVLLDEAVERT